MEKPSEEDCNVSNAVLVVRMGELRQFVFVWLVRIKNFK
jgi:hypothetical protein